MFLSRPKFMAAALALALGACVSGRVVYVPVPTPAEPASAPAPVEQPDDSYLEPLEVTVGRPVRDRFVVQTNRPAYVAIFEVIPEEGITIVRPTSGREHYVVAGLSAVRVPWSTATVSRTSRTNDATRYLYAVASDEPLRIDDATFEPGFLRMALGSRVYRSTDPYATMHALSRRFVQASVAEEEWAEDVVVVRPEITGPRVAYVYCPGGMRYEVPAEMADRVHCARPDRGGRYDAPAGRVGTRSRDGGSAAPDSVIGDDRRRVRPRVPTQVGRGPIDRVREPVVAGNAGRGPEPKGGVPASQDGAPGRRLGDIGDGNGNDRGNGNANGQSNHGSGRSNGNGDGRANGNGRGNGNGNRSSNGYGRASEPVWRRVSL